MRLLVSAGFLAAALPAWAAPATLTLAGDWQVKVAAAGAEAVVAVPGPETVRVADEKLLSLPYTTLRQRSTRAARSWRASARRVHGALRARPRVAGRAGGSGRGGAGPRQRL
jgi:hypothetical protein